jgi:hypothetical protein
VGVIDVVEVDRDGDGDVADEVRFLCCTPASTARFKSPSPSTLTST